MKVSLLDIFLAVSSFLVTPAFGIPITNNAGSLEADISACSAEVEGLLAMKQWDDISRDQLLNAQREYLADKKEDLTQCVEFEDAESVDECVALGVESSETMPVIYINHLCQLLH